MLVATTGVDLCEGREKGDLKSVMVGSQRRCASGCEGICGRGRERFEVWGGRLYALSKWPLSSPSNTFGGVTFVFSGAPWGIHTTDPSLPVIRPRSWRATKDDELRVSRIGCT